MWADTMADFFQMIILIAGLLIVFPVLMKDMGGIACARAQTPDKYFHFFPQNASALDWLNYIQAWMIVGIGSLPAQDLFSRTMAAKNPTISRWASIIAGVLYITIGMLPVLMGIFGRLVMPESTGEAILIELVLKFLSPPLIAVMCGALLAAIMSSADSAILAPASIIGHNIVPSLKPDASEALKLKWCKLSVPLLGILSLILAVYFKNIYKLCQESWGVLLTGVAAPLIAGVYFKKANTRGALAGSVAGIGSWLIVKVSLPDYPSNLIGFAVSSVVLVIVSVAGRGKE
jgi:Na+/proline symporter